MKVEYINPFVVAFEEVFEMMLDLAVKRGEARLGAFDAENEGEAITSVIGISGAAEGTVALVFPKATAMRIGRRFLDEDVNELDDKVRDALGELVNMVAGSAKAKFGVQPPPDLSLPEVLDGQQYSATRAQAGVWIEVPFASPVGDMYLDVSLPTEPPAADRSAGAGS
jgi:chemotaxis protein CheX